MRFPLILLSLVILLSVSMSQIPKSAYVVNGLGESLTIIDLQNQTVLQPPEILGLYPNDIKIAGDRAYVINSGINDIQIFDLNTQNSTGSIDLGSGTNPYRMDFVNDSIVAVSMWLVDSVYFVNTRNRQIIRRVPVGTSPEGIKHHQGKVYVANSGYTAAGYEAGKVSIIDLSNYQVSEIAVNTNPQALAVDTSGNLIVSCSGDYQGIGAQLDFIDLSAGSVVFSEVVNIPLLESIWQIAVNSRNELYIGTYGAGVLVYDVGQKVYIRDETNPLSGGPALAFDNQDNVYVTSFVSDSVHVYSRAHQNIADYLVGSGPLAIAVYDPASTPVQQPVAMVPETTELFQNYPNPFNPRTHIYFRLTRGEFVRLEIFNVQGQKVRSFVNRRLTAGLHQVIWNGNDDRSRPVPSGVYFYRLKVGELQTTRQMNLIR